MPNSRQMKINYQSAETGSNYKFTLDLITLMYFCRSVNNFQSRLTITGSDQGCHCVTTQDRFSQGGVNRQFDIRDFVVKLYCVTLNYHTMNQSIPPKIALFIKRLIN